MTSYLCDVNVWLALTLDGHVHHPTARDWLESIEPPDRIAFHRLAQQGLVRLLTHASVVAPYGLEPLDNDEAWRVLQAFLADDRVATVADEPPGVEDVWGALARQPTPAPKVWTDAYLAAVAITGGHRLVTFDSGFRRFERLEAVVLGG